MKILFWYGMNLKRRFSFIFRFILKFDIWDNIWFSEKRKKYIP